MLENNDGKCHGKAGTYSESWMERIADCMNRNAETAGAQ